MRVHAWRVHPPPSQDNEALLLGKVSKLSKQLAAAQQEVASKERQLEATGSALDQVGARTGAGCVFGMGVVSCYPRGAAGGTFRP